MKLPITIQPARVRYKDRDLIPIQLRHVAVAILILPAIGLAAYIVARFIFSIPTP